MNVNQNDVRADLTDILKRYHNIRFAVQKTQYLIVPRNHDLTDTSAALVEFQITHPPQFLTIFDIDHILAF